MPHAYTEDQLVEQPAVQLFAELGWRTVSASEEVFGRGGTLGRETKSETVLVPRLRKALEKLNPALPPEAITMAVDELARDRSAMSVVAANCEMYALLKDGVKVSVPDREHGGQKIARVRVVDWENPAANDFLLVSQMSITGTLYTRRPDLIGFINGLPMVVVEFKKPGVSARAAFDDNLTCYKADTDRQQEILDFIREQQQLRGMTPSTGEIQEQFGFASPNAVTSHLQALTRKGVLHREPNKARGLVLTDSYRDKAMIEIPIYGSIAAGLPEGQQQQSDGCVAVDVETLRLPKGARVFALKVRGDSMNGAGILPGDIVVLEFKEAKHGDIVAALIDGETTLKRYVVQRGKPFLKAENPRFANLIPAQELVIQGVQIALLRVLKR